jgi:hypothetical protein
MKKNNELKGKCNTVTKSKQRMIYEMIAISCLCLILGFGLGMTFATGHIIDTTLKNLNHIDNLDVIVDINETKMVEAIYPLVQEEIKNE